ncbi:MAG: hypothetical protein ACE5ES_04215 [Candidatus Nanoarchaeia archaeon]
MSGKSYGILYRKPAGFRGGRDIYEFLINKEYLHAEEEMKGVKLVKKFDGFSDSELDEVKCMALAHMGSEGELLEKIGDCLEGLCPEFQNQKPKNSYS